MSKWHNSHRIEDSTVIKNGATEMHFLRQRDAYGMLLNEKAGERRHYHFNNGCHNKLAVVACDNHKGERFSKCFLQPAAVSGLSTCHLILRTFHEGVTDSHRAGEKTEV